MKNRKPYPTDLTDEQWKLLETILPPSELRGRKREVDLREIVNAILYLLVEGIRWRSLPHDFPNWQTVYYYSFSGATRSRRFDCYTRKGK